MFEIRNELLSSLNGVFEEFLHAPIKKLEKCIEKNRN
jgi:hypothetical protein